MSHTTKTTRMAGKYGCRVYRDGKLIVEGRADNRWQIGDVYRDLLRTLDKLGGDAFTSAARARNTGLAMQLQA